jgi:biotin carboxylase
VNLSLANKNLKIAIIGASYLQLPIVEKANKLGYESYCFAFSEGAVCKDHCTEFFPISILEKEEITDICRTLDIDAVVSIASDLAVVTVNFIANELGLIGNPISSSLRSTHKHEMKNYLSEFNLPVAKFALCKNSDDLNEIENFNYPIIVKPVDRSGSLGVSKIESKNELLEAFEAAFSNSIAKEVIVEEFISGTEVSIEGISQNGVHTILAITDKVTTNAPHFVELEHHQPSSLDTIIQDEIRTLIPKALDVLQIENGASHSELIITANNKIYINEIGARMGGDFIGSDLVELSTGFDYLKAVLDVSLGEEIRIDFGTNRSSGVIFRNELNSTDFDKIIPSENFIIKHETSLENKAILKKSNDRGNYLIYQSEKRINFDIT